MDCTTCGSSDRPMCPAQAKRSTRSGSSTCTCSALSMRPCTSRGLARRGARGGRAGTSVASASGRLPSVADMPHTCRRGFQPDRRASASCTCTPRLLPTSSCHSSTTTSCTLARRSCASARASSSDTLSGVVTSTVGRRRSCAARSPLAVSPVRRPLLQCGARSGRGSCRARSESAASARMGVIHSTVSGGGLFASFLGAACAISTGARAEKRSKAPSHTA